LTLRYTIFADSSANGSVKVRGHSQ